MPSEPPLKCSPHFQGLMKQFSFDFNIYPGIENINVFRLLRILFKFVFRDIESYNSHDETYERLCSGEINTFWRVDVKLPEA